MSKWISPSFLSVFIWLLCISRFSSTMLAVFPKIWYTIDAHDRWKPMTDKDGSVDNGGHSLRTEKIFVGKTSSGFPEDINREDEVTLTSVFCVQPRLNAQIYWLKSPFILTSFSVQPRLNAKTSWVQGNEEMSMCSISNGKWGINCLYRNRAGW